MSNTIKILPLLILLLATACAGHTDAEPLECSEPVNVGHTDAEPLECSEPVNVGRTLAVDTIDRMCGERGVDCWFVESLTVAKARPDGIIEISPAPCGEDLPLCRFALLHEIAVSRGEPDPYCAAASRADVDATNAAACWFAADGTAPRSCDSFAE